MGRHGRLKLMPADSARQVPRHESVTRVSCVPFGV